MDSEVIGRAVYVIEADFGDASQQIQDFQKDFQTATSSAKENAASLDSGLANLTLGVNNLKQAFSLLSGSMSIIDDLTDSYNRYEASMNGVAAVARAKGQDIAESLQVVKDASADGLISPSDAAAAVKNLEAYGFSAQQAARMISVMTDAAVYNRQANYSVSEAVRVTTEGIRMENSVLSDAAGINKNIAKMYDEYAKSLGKSSNELTQAEKAQAVYNGVLNEGGIFAGNAAEYTGTLAGSQDKLGTAIEKTKANLGKLFSAFSPVVDGIADWVNENQELVGGLLATVGVLGAAGGLIATINLVKKAITGVSQSLAIFSAIGGAATGNVIKLGLVLGAVAVGVGVAHTIGKLSEAEEDMGEAAEGATANLDDQGGVSEETAKKIAKLRDQISNLTRDYERDLKQVGVKHEENLQSLNEQIEEANIDYHRAVEERVADFNVTLAKQERSHQETVDELMTQLAFLQRYNNDYNKQKLAQVEFALAKEQQLYQRETEAQRAELELQNQADKEKLEARLASLQEEQANELAFMEKHREALNSVQHVMLLDEIESLQERYNEQKKSYEQQIAEAGTAGAEVGSSFADNVNETIEDTLNKNYSKVGSDIGRTIVEGMGEGIGQAANAVWDWIKQGGPVGSIWKLILGEQGFNNAMGNRSSGGGEGWATGGYTGRGNPDEVAGLVHRGEYVIPANQVDQSTGEPKIGTTQNITINLSGTFATSASERRRVAEQIVSAIKQVNQARLS